jgi:RNA polymerase sigma-70 factor, ECF subfamily
MADGPAAGLALVDGLEQTAGLSGYYLLPATRADLLRRLQRNVEAASAYRRALALAPTDAERRLLRRRHAEVSGESAGWVSIWASVHSSWGETPR